MHSLVVTILGLWLDQSDSNDQQVTLNLKSKRKEKGSIWLDHSDTLAQYPNSAKITAGNDCANNRMLWTQQCSLCSFPSWFKIIPDEINSQSFF